MSGVKRYHVTTFGCQMNAHDSERIKGMLEELGLGEATTQEEADILVFNTCTIREKPDQKFAAHLAQAAAVKRRDPDKVIAVGGCYAEAQRERLFELYPEVDVAFGPGSIPHLGEWLRARRLAGRGRPGDGAGPAPPRGQATPARPPPPCRCTASGASRRGSRSRWGATPSARTASSRQCAAARSAGDPARSWRGAPASPARACAR